MTEIRVRFAPSPSGYLHVGGARTALFNWLFARHHGGKFILRVEDTDKNRSSDESIAAITNSLRWLMLDWDEGPEIGGPHGPYFQSQRGEIYQRYLDRLIAGDKVYRCFCSTEKLEEERKQAMAEKKPPRYSGTCRDLSNDEASERVCRGEQVVYRYKNPRVGDVVFDDLVRGAMSFPVAEMDDFVIARTDRTPLYNFAVVCDDLDMRISHVIRGDDHLSNTPRQLLLYQALGETPPLFAHVSQILGPDGSRLSKRHGATSIDSYRDEGFLTGAFVNFLALLGWAYNDERELFSLQELVEAFSLERVSRSPAIYNQDKLLWMNGLYLRQLTPDQLAAAVVPYLAQAGMVDPQCDSDAKFARVLGAVTLEQEKFKLLSDAPRLLNFLLVGNMEYPFEEDAVKKHLEGGKNESILRDVAEMLATLEPFNLEHIEQAIRSYAEAQGMGVGKVIHPLRAALSGRNQGPGLFQMMEFLGRESCLTRIQWAQDLFPPA
jgi:nondiscriminating glutamyl-tRNA synthetase